MKKYRNEVKEKLKKGEYKLNQQYKEGIKWLLKDFQLNLKSLNWHLNNRCNYSCTFCFGQFPNLRGSLSKINMLKIPQLVRDIGIEKITLTGGEPFLCSNLGVILKESKNHHLKTMIVSNGALISEGFLLDNHKYIDWIGLSLDSLNEETELKLGKGFGTHVEKIREISPLIKDYGVKLKINSVITSLNYHEDMSAIIKELNPDRWKVFQVLKVEGENNDRVDPLLISEEQFMSFVNRHKHLNPIYESNDLFRGSYVMLDPLGRFFQNSKGFIEYSRSILEVDPLEAIAEVGWDRERFLKRGGIYEW